MNNGDLDGLPPWVAAMRKAAMDAIKPGDVAEIVKVQVQKAKNGDKGAIQFIFDYVLGSHSFKGATFVQNNYLEPTDAAPGSDGKLDLMRKRAERGLPLCNKNDGARVDLK